MYKRPPQCSVIDQWRQYGKNEKVAHEVLLKRNLFVKYK